MLKNRLFRNTPKANSNNTIKQRIEARNKLRLEEDKKKLQGLIFDAKEVEHDVNHKIFLLKSAAALLSQIHVERRDLEKISSNLPRVIDEMHTSITRFMRQIPRKAFLVPESKISGKISTARKASASLLKRAGRLSKELELHLAILRLAKHREQLDEKTTAAHLKYLDILEIANAHIQNILDDHHSMVNGIPRKKQDVYLSKVLSKVLEPYHGKIEVSTHFDTVPPLANRHEVDFIRIFGNLIHNANEADAKKIHVRLRKRGEHVEVFISDTGKGIPKEMQTKVFERGVTIGKKGGSGLGLKIAEQIVRQNSGELRLIGSQTHGPYKGTLFGVRFKIGKSQNELN